MSTSRPPGPPLWFGLFVLVVAPFLVLAAVLVRAPTLGSPPGSFLMDQGATFVSNGDYVVVYVPTSRTWTAECRLYDEDSRLLSPQAHPASLITDVDGAGYGPLLGYRPEAGTRITVVCDGLERWTRLLISPPISRQSALLPVAVGGGLAFVMVGFGTVIVRGTLRERRAARPPGRPGG